MGLHTPPPERIINEEVKSVSMKETRRWLYSLWQTLLSIGTKADAALPASQAVVGGEADTVPRLDAQARLGLGTDTPHGRLEVSGGTTVGDLLLDIDNPVGSNRVYIGRVSDTPTDNTTIIFRNRLGNVAAQMDTGNGHWLAGIDNTQNLGGAGNRWAVVYAGTGAINTSDARQKTDVRAFSEAEVLAAKDMSAEIGLYQFLSSLATKGDAARLHTGLTVQRAIAIMESHGLDPFRYGFICYDEWSDEYVEQSAVLDVEGNETSPALRVQTRVAGNAYAFRDNELDKFILRGLHARLEDLEARMVAW